MKYILSIDGGGIRGILPCLALVALEKETGKLTREIFSYVAGTSTGALLAAAIVAGLPATQILDIYTKRSKEIFTPGQPWATAKRITQGCMYDTSSIKKVLASEFGEAAQWVLNDSHIGILMTAVHVNRHPWYFVKDNPKNAKTTGDLGLLDCATASAAAPTYFGPWYVPPTKGNLVGWCFDGGTGVTGNPVYQACVEALEYDDYTLADTRVVSLGTGYCPNDQVNPPCGLMSTLQWTIDTLVSAPEDQQTEIVRRHYPGILQRINWQLPRTVGMADLSSIPDLLAVGNRINMDWNSVIHL